jgi:elongation factor G
MEPIHDLTVKVPEDLLGNVMTDLQTRRAIIMGMDSDGKHQIIKAKVPLAEMYKYSTSLRSQTQGRATFKIKFSSFEQVPQNIQDELVKES